ncbi:MAG: hypothetical protein KJ736_09320, partial [Candidatus Omnitrophica bacterium]|nr:hypothetical protein [Candidatus Omnitrophota bacterium]
KIFPTLASAISTLFGNKEIFFPFIVICFIQLFSLEILNLVHRSPLNLFFAPIIRKLYGEIYLHYPLNFTLLPQLFQYVQIVFYVFVSTFLIAVAVKAVVELESGREDGLNFGSLVKKTLSSYVSLVLTGLLVLAVILLSFKLFDKVYARAVLISATGGIKFAIKAVIIYGKPFFYLLLNAIATALFAYVIPVIIVDKRKIFSAVWVNFKLLFEAPWFTFCIVAIPYVFLVPVLLLKYINFMGNEYPEIKFWLLVIDVFVMVLIDAVVYTSLTMFYIMKKGESK